MSTILVLPDEVLEDIFLRLDDAADVVRAAAACTAHRRVARNRGFLRRYRLQHPPPVLGFLESMGTGRFLHAEAPHKSAPAARALAQAADFTFAFLPMDPDGSRRWHVRDARDGRVLLSRRSADAGATFLDLVICDPLHRRYVEIPAIPEDLWDKRYSTEMKSEPFLVPAREEEDESKFRLIYNWVCRYKIITFLYNSDTRNWCQGTSFSFLPERNITNPLNLVRHYVGNCFCWVHRNWPNWMLELDPVEMAFSFTRLPAGTDAHDLNGLAVVDAGVSKLGIMFLYYSRYLDLHSKAWQNNGGSAEQWQHDKHHILSEGYKHCNIIGTAEGCLVLLDSSAHIVQYSIMDPKTFLVQRFCKGNRMYAVEHALPYARFPPPLSPPSI